MASKASIPKPLTTNDLLVESRAVLRMMEKAEKLGKKQGNHFRCWMSRSVVTTQWLDAAADYGMNNDNLLMETFGVLHAHSVKVDAGTATPEDFPDWPVTSQRDVVEILEKIESWERHG